MDNILIFGGTFDPVHNGHLELAEHALIETKAKQCIWVPNKQPLLKNDARATTQQRLDMLKLAIKQSTYHEKFTLDLCEIKRQSPSYMVDTLRHFRKMFGEKQSLSLLMGEDAFVKLNQWHEWEKLIELAHIIVVTRPTQNPIWPKAIKVFFAKHFQSKATYLSQKPSGIIYKLGIKVDISSSNIRQSLSQHSNLEQVCPKAVSDYIIEHHLYT